MTKPQAVNPVNRKEWVKAVEHHAKRIKGMLDETIFGYKIGKNPDALIVAVYMKGVEEGRKHSEEWLKNYLAEKEAKNE